MKIQYKFTNETVEIEVDDEWANLIIDLDRQEYNNDHKETRRHVSLSSMEYEGEFFATEDSALVQIGDSFDMMRAIEKLPTRQKEVIYLYFYDGLNMVEIATRLGVNPSTVREALNSAKKNLKKYSETPHF